MSVVIVGAGMMGLTLGYRLSQAGVAVTILEAQNQVGGLSTWFDYGGFTWDKYYHVILRSDDHLLQLIDELDLSDKLCWMPTKTGFLWHGKFLSMSSHTEFLRFPVLSLPQKARLALGILYTHYIQDPKKLDGVTAVQWLTKVFGKTVYAVMWEPLIVSKFGVLKDEVPAAILQSTISRYFSTRSKAGGGESMGHLWGTGLKALFEALVDAIRAKGGVVECGVAIKTIDKNQVTAADGLGFAYRELISTVPTPILHKIAPFTQAIFKRPRPPQFLGVIRLALVLKRPLTPFYVTNILDKGLPFTGIIEVWALTEPAEMQGYKLVMIPRYDVPNSPWFDKTDDEIREAFLAPLRAILPDLYENILHSFVHREKIVQALWIGPPPDDSGSVSSPDGRVWNINAELAGRDTLNNNAIVRVADTWAERFLQDCGVT